MYGDEAKVLAEAVGSASWPRRRPRATSGRAWANSTSSRRPLRVLNARSLADNDPTTGRSSLRVGVRLLDLTGEWSSASTPTP